MKLISIYLAYAVFHPIMFLFLKLFNLLSENWKASRKTRMPEPCSSNVKGNALWLYYNAFQPRAFTKEYSDFDSEWIFNKTTLTKSSWTLYFITEAVLWMSFVKKSVFKNFENITGKHLYRSVWLKINKIIQSVQINFQII